MKRRMRKKVASNSDAASGHKTKPPKVLYRFFRTEQEARDLIKGKVFLSTLSFQRARQDGREDPLEGMQAWHVPDIDPTSDPALAEAVRTAAAKGGALVIGDGPLRTTCTGNVIMEVEEDGYVLCMTYSSRLTGFGAYGVRIASPLAFLEAVNKRFLASRPPGEEWWTGLRPMRYIGRESSEPTGPEFHPAHVGPEGNRREEECRALWIPDSPRALTPVTIDVPEAERFCSLL